MDGDQPWDGERAFVASTTSWRRRGASGARPPYRPADDRSWNVARADCPRRRVRTAATNAAARRRQRPNEVTIAWNLAAHSPARRASSSTPAAAAAQATSDTWTSAPRRHFRRRATRPLLRANDGSELHGHVFAFHRVDRRRAWPVNRQSLRPRALCPVPCALRPDRRP